jgi:hypothetical protein
MFRTLANISIRKESKQEAWFTYATTAEVTSSASNTIDSPDPTPKTYTPAEGLDLPYTDIKDNTEGVPAFTDLPIPASARTLVDVGAGAFDHAKQWVEENTPITSYFPVDPYRRAQSHNEDVQRQVEAAGGADVVTSISVLNVIREETDREAHIRLCRRIARPGGLVCFKVWAGSWPVRGTGKGVYEEERDVFQANRWAHDFLPEITKVFGEANCYADVQLNMVVACVREATTAASPSSPI